MAALLIWFHLGRPQVWQNQSDWTVKGLSLVSSLPSVSSLEGLWQHLAALTSADVLNLWLLTRSGKSVPVAPWSPSLCLPLLSEQPNSPGIYPFPELTDVSSK